MLMVTLFIIGLFNKMALDNFWINLLEFSLVTIFSFATYFIFTYILKTEEAQRIKQFLLNTLDKTLK